MCACVFCNNCVYVRDSFVMCCVVMCGVLCAILCLCFLLGVCVCLFVIQCVMLSGICNYVLLFWV